MKTIEKTSAPTRAQYTPGQWMRQGVGILQHSNGGTIRTQIIEAKGWGRIGEWYDCSNEGEANARLIAAAPELMAALERMRGEFLTVIGYTGGDNQKFVNLFHSCLNQASSAIKRAIVG